MTRRLTPWFALLAIAATSISPAVADEPTSPKKTSDTKKPPSDDALDGHTPRKKEADTKEKTTDLKRQLDGEKREK